MKRYYKSKTLWFNAVMASLMALESNLSLIQPFVDGNVYQWAILLIAVGNAGLRVITTQEIK